MTWKSRLRFFFYGNSAWGFLGRVCLLGIALWLGAMAYILSGKPVITAAPSTASASTSMTMADSANTT